MADATQKVFELKDGARIVVETTLYEDLDKNGNGRKLHDHTDGNGKVLRKVQTRAEDGQRFVKRSLVYPFPAGLIKDEFTGKEPVAMTAAQLGHSIGEWFKDIEALREAGGRVHMTNADGKEINGVVPLDVIPTPAEVFGKGFKLEIQGPLNAQMKKDHETIVGGGAKATKASTKTLSSIG